MVVNLTRYQHYHKYQLYMIIRHIFLDELYLVLFVAMQGFVISPHIYRHTEARVKYSVY